MPLWGRAWQGQSDGNGLEKTREGASDLHLQPKGDYRILFRYRFRTTDHVISVQTKQTFYFRQGLSMRLVRQLRVHLSAYPSDHSTIHLFVCPSINWVSIQSVSAEQRAWDFDSESVSPFRFNSFQSTWSASWITHTRDARPSSGLQCPTRKLSYPSSAQVFSPSTLIIPK